MTSKTEKTENSGSCLCGKVHFTTNEASQHVGACHCGMCRKWGGGPLMAVDCGSNVSFQGEENISLYDSSAWAQRGFCRHCGSHLFYRIKASQQTMIPAGLFDDCDSFEFRHQVFIDNKPAFYSFSNETRNMTAAEIFAMYSKPDAT